MLSNRWDSLWRDRRVPWLLLLASALLAAGTLWGFWNYQNLVTDLAVEAEGRTTRLAAVRIRDELDQFPSALIALARSADIISQDPARVQAALRQAPPVREGLFDAGLFMLNNFGVVTAAEPPRPELVQQDRSSRTYFRDLLTNSPASAVFSDAQSDGPAGAPVIVVSVPVIDGEGRFVGALAGLLRLGQSTISPYYATLVKLRVSPDGTAYVIDRSNRILFDSASLHDGEQYADPQPSGSGNAAGASDAGTALRTRDAAGRDLLISRAAIPDTPWTLVIEKDWASVAAAIQLYADLLLALLGLGVILPLVTLALFVRQDGSWVRRGGAIGRDSQITQRVERALLADPAPLLPGWEIAVHREPAPAIGRVFHDLLLGADGCLTVILAETSRLGAVGNGGSEGADGVAEVLSMVAVRTLLRSAARDLLSPAAALQRTNGLLCPDLPPGVLITCLYCRLDPVSGALAVGNADQARPLKLPCGLGGSEDSSVSASMSAGVQLVGGKDPPLGLQLDSTYRGYGVQLAEGDSLFLCSSEVLDVCNAAGEPFGRQRLEQVLADPAIAAADGKARIAAVADALRQFAGGKWANDRDAILIVLDRLPSGAAAPLA